MLFFLKARVYVAPGLLLLYGGDEVANAKTPTRRQRQIIQKRRLNSNNWLIQKNPPGELYIIHRVSGTKKLIKYSTKY